LKDEKTTSSRKQRVAASNSYEIVIRTALSHKTGRLFSAIMVNSEHLFTINGCWAAYSCVAKPLVSRRPTTTPSPVSDSISSFPVPSQHCRSTSRWCGLVQVLAFCPASSFCFTQPNHDAILITLMYGPIYHIPPSWQNPDSKCCSSQESLEGVSSVQRTSPQHLCRLWGNDLETWQVQI
jgi:hypothetical protein